MTCLADEIRSAFGARERPPARPPSSPEAIEEEAAARLYGERTGMVDASPASPPLGAPSPAFPEGPGT